LASIEASTDAAGEVKIRLYAEAPGTVVIKASVSGVPMAPLPGNGSLPIDMASVVFVAVGASEGSRSGGSGFGSANAQSGSDVGAVAVGSGAAAPGQATVAVPAVATVPATPAVAATAVPAAVPAPTAAAVPAAAPTPAATPAAVAPAAAVVVPTTPQYIWAASDSGKAVVFAQLGLVSAPYVTDKAIAIITESSNGTHVLEDLARIDALNRELSLSVYRIAAIVDGDIIDDAYQLYSLRIDISDMDMTAAQKSMLTGVFIDPLTRSFNCLGGILSANGEAFDFRSSHAGDHFLMLSDTLVEAKFTVGQTDFLVNGKVRASDSAPIIVDGRLMMPLRLMSEALSAEVGWDADTQTATVTKNGRATAVTIGKALPYGMGTAAIVDGRTYVPLRYISQAMSINLIWDDSTRSVTLYG
jgi:hypothetical protein